MTKLIKPVFLCASLLALASCATVRVTEVPRTQPQDVPLPDTRPVDAAPIPGQVGPWHYTDATRMPAASDGYQPPTRIGFLLPLSGRLARAAAPVRDGFLAGYYAEHRARPEIQFYDTAAGGPVAAYRKAEADGNTFIIGPLGREEVDAVFTSGALSVPMLALNRGDSAPPQGHGSFSLSPEDEGIAAAEFLIDRGARNVLVLQGLDDSMRRAADAFGVRIGQAAGSRAPGSRVFQALVIGDDLAQASPQLQAAIDAAAAAGTPIDSVFYAVRGSKAHLLAAQLHASGLDLVPAVATSQITLGAGDPLLDMTLEGIAFPTETWTVRGVAGLPSAASLAEHLPTARGAAARLFAFGHDAWLVTAFPSIAASTDGDALRGATGRLRIDIDGNVMRTPTWSTFRDGQTVPLD